MPSETESTQAPEAGHAEAIPEGTTPEAPAPGRGPGHAEGAEGTPTEPPSVSPTPPVATSSQENDFFDRKGYDEAYEKLPDEVKPHVSSLVKTLQGDYTRKTQALKDQRQAIEAVGLFEQGMRSDPVKTIMELAGRYGLTPEQLVATSEPRLDAETEPQSWEEVYQRAAADAKKEVLAEIAPYIGQVQQIQSKSVEEELDQIDPNWRRYEDKMSELMQKAPGLSNLPIKDIYNLARPESEIKAEAMAEAQRQMQKETKAAVTHGSEPQRKTTPGTKKVESFSDAVDVAKQILAERGTQ